jgi:hypothetical protein
MPKTEPDELKTFNTDEVQTAIQKAKVKNARLHRNSSGGQERLGNSDATD